MWYHIPQSYIRPKTRNRRSLNLLADALNDILFGPGGELSIGNAQDPANAGSGGSFDNSPTQTQDYSQQFPTNVASAMNSETPQPISSVDKTSLVASTTLIQSVQASRGPQPTATSSVVLQSSMSSHVGSSTSLTPSSNSLSSASSYATHSFTSSSLSASAATSSVSSPVDNTSSRSSSSSYNKASFYAGIVLAAIAASAFFILLLNWCIRTRKRSRRHALQRANTWPWDRDTTWGHDTTGGLTGVPDNLETGLVPAIAESDVGIWIGDESKGLQSLTSALRHHRADEREETSFATLPDSHAYPLPPAHLRVNTRLASPYPTVPVRSANSSVPDLAPDLGTLQVANLMPGDVSSDGEASRANSVMGVEAASPDYGVPYRLMMSDRPRFLGVEGSGLDVPWAPLNLHRRRSSASAKAGASGNTIGVGLDPLSLPSQSDPPTANESGGWAASIRSNLVNAFNAVVGGNDDDGRPTDILTVPPHRKTRSRTGHGPQSGVGIMSRGRSLRSVHSEPKEWTLEETSEGAGVVHICLDELHDKSVWSRPDRIVQDDIQIPPAVLIRSRDREFPSSLPHLTRADSSSSTSSSDSYEKPSPRVDAFPPRLPSIPPMSRSSTAESNVSNRPTTRKESVVRKVQPRKKTRKMRRPTMLTRKSSSYCSAVSVGSDMSRTSSMCSEHLTDAEQFARKVLRERRKRMIEMGIGRGQTRSGPDRTRTKSRKMLG